MISKSKLALAVFGATALCAAVSLAAPKGTSTSDKQAKTETYADWQVACKAQNDKRHCAAVQQVFSTTQGKPEVRQRIMAIELMRAGDGAAGTLILPFGIEVGKGVSLGIAGHAGPPLPFKTCLPAGCIVPLEFGPEALTALKKADRLTIDFLTAADGKQKTMGVSLKGFGQAFDRLSVLEKKN
ncbi:MAG: invasion associated locus B family protein [Rhizobiales bacterium]|nr:invasion associated locus B family protein [Hyphomicrobiales bacterium]OJY01678.1 MAG: hypothetical protein BGP07_00010 [Rhizobiales bacterium 63-22]